MATIVPSPIVYSVDVDEPSSFSVYVSIPRSTVGTSGSSAYETETVVRVAAPNPSTTVVLRSGRN